MERRTRNSVDMNSIYFSLRFETRGQVQLLPKEGWYALEVATIYYNPEYEHILHVLSTLSCPNSPILLGFL